MLLSKYDKNYRLLIPTCNNLHKEPSTHKKIRQIMYNLHKYRPKNCIIKMTKPIVKMTAL